ncbi:hypothetical protein BDV33DRAFT_26159 [Aspergillus novoparasiticus]|uniref:Uncharacterized protein n=1 Tax=Aspergillus novoparasiticus TaxID=986946 RepID=A0A5N6ECL7_9EURO|nr:hypothetical protein BDV33DRAFT_26159 [Aspergillus novoparasiticus]
MRFEGRISRPFSEEKLRGMIHHFRRIMKELSLPDRTKTVKSSLIFGGLELTPKLEPTRVSPEPVGWRPQISRLSPERSLGPISYSLFSWSFPFLFSDFFLACVPCPRSYFGVPDFEQVSKQRRPSPVKTCGFIRYYEPCLVSGFTGLRYSSDVHRTFLVCSRSE